MGAEASMNTNRLFSETGSHKGRRLQPAIAWLAVAAVLLSAPLRAADSVAGPPPAGITAPAAAMEQQWGVRLLGIHLSAAG